MTVPFKPKFARCAAVIVAGLIPAASSADITELLDSPTMVLSFSGFGAPALDELPMEISNDSAATPVRAPLEIVDLGTTPGSLDVQVARAPRRVVQNTWTIGVFR